MKILPLFLTALGLAGLAGCQSVNDRIEEKPGLFESLDRETQARIKEGIIDLGYSKDMVYLALGEPNRKRQTQSKETVTETWIYNTYFQRYDGQRFVGYDRNVYYDKKNDTYRVFYTPRYTDVYTPETEERIRIVFRNDEAVSIEQGTD
jgi:hypothetical protein